MGKDKLATFKNNPKLLSLYQGGCLLKKAGQVEVLDQIGVDICGPDQPMRQNTG